LFGSGTHGRKTGLDKKVVTIKHTKLERGGGVDRRGAKFIFWLERALNKEGSEIELLRSR